jgi:hypothetical protein
MPINMTTEFVERIERMDRAHEDFMRIIMGLVHREFASCATEGERRLLCMRLAKRVLETASMSELTQLQKEIMGTTPKG